MSYPVQSAIAYRERLSDGGANPLFVQVGLGDQPLATSCTTPPTPTRLFILTVISGDGGALVPGTYPATSENLPGTLARVTYGTTPNDAGTPTARDLHIAVSGLVTLSAIDAERAVGTFDVMMTLEDGGSSVGAGGSFSAPTELCP